MKNKPLRCQVKKIWLIPALLCLLALTLFLIYTGTYSRAEPTALAALATDDTVTVTQTDYGWRFDGPSEEDVLIFYPGGKVEETAYAPLLHLLAEQGMDVCLVKMPFHLAVFGINKAASVSEAESYENRYIGGHSLGGAMAAVYAAQSSDPLSGVILLAAYPTKPLPEDTQVLCLFGTEDGVLNLDKVYEGEKYAPGRFFLHTISGGNHAQFGNYGLQKGDGTALISAEEQQEETVEVILRQLVSSP